MGTTKWEAPSGPSTILTTELNTLTDGSLLLSGVVSNDQSGELYMFADFEFYIATQGSARDTDARMELYLLSTVDGSNYQFGDGSTYPPPASHVGDFQLDNVVTARYVIVRGVRLPPEDFKLLLINETGENLASSGNTLKMIKYNIQT